ncbi:MAG: hypothetical protein K1X51_11970 [Rhodospirillaceae bacterium]|nr:hypothetical protein [Rhodospirillaceae bacterium]
MKYSFSLETQHEELRSALRRFEQGLFEKAGEQVVAVLKEQPGNTDAIRLLRLIERRLWPKPNVPPILVWQFRPKDAWEYDWVRFLLDGVITSEKVDNTWSYLAPAMIVVDNRLVPEKVPYYQRAFEAGCKVVLVHLSDEAFNDDTGAYKYCEAVIRNYRSDVKADLARMFFLPLGYKAGFARGHAPKSVEARKHLWSFAGDPNKLSRGEMLDTLAQVGGGTWHLTSGFGAADCLSTADYRALMDESVMIPCPGGWSNLETFRVYEALEAGCIPFVEKRKGYDYYRALLGPHPLPTVATWAEGAALLRKLKDEGALPAMQQTCMAWWADYKKRLKAGIGGFVADALNPPPTGEIWPRTYP